MDRKKVIENLESLKQRLILQKDVLGYGCHVEDITNAIVLLKEQEAEIRQLRLALDITKGTCKGINVGGR